MGELVFVGLGLFDENDISLRGLEVTRNADFIFIEVYTNILAGLNIKNLKHLVKKDVVILTRKNLEELSGEKVISAAKHGKAVLLVPGDPMIATTHIDLRIRAEKEGVKTHIIHGASIISAAIALAGLQNYKFGRSVTIPFSKGYFTSETPYNVIKLNLASGLHTLCFLDIVAEKAQYMRIYDAIEMLLTVENSKQESVITDDMLIIGIARAGSETPVIKAGPLGQVQNFAFGKPPHTLIFPGPLHYMEAEALMTFAHAPESISRFIR